MCLPTRSWRSVYNWNYGTFTYHKKIKITVWPGAAHAAIGVKENPQVYSMQQQILPNFTQNGRRKMATEKPVFN